jgi:hypothetical protein
MPNLDSAATSEVCDDRIRDDDRWTTGREHLGVSVSDPATAAVVADAPQRSTAQPDEAIASSQNVKKHWPPAARYWLRTPGRSLRDSRRAGQALSGGSSGYAASAWFGYDAGLDVAVEVVQDDATGYAAIHRHPGGIDATAPWNSGGTSVVEDRPGVAPAMPLS